MIHLVDDYYIQVTDLCYIVGKNVTRTKKNDGTQYQAFVPKHYYHNMRTATLGACEAARKDRLSNMTCELKEAVIALKQVNAQFEEALTKALGEDE